MLTVKGEIDIARTQRDGQDDSERERAHLDHQRRPYNLERYGCNASSCEDGMNVLVWILVTMGLVLIATLGYVVGRSVGCAGCRGRRWYYFGSCYRW